MTQLSEQIISLRKEGKSYKEIQDTTGASKGTISYHCGQGQKEKTISRTKEFRKRNPHSQKISRFNNSSGRTLLTKTNVFKRSTSYQRRCSIVNNTDAFGIEEVNTLIDKQNGCCYLTGEPIDFSKPQSFHFDHIIPKSKGGTNKLENLGIASKRANMFKSDMTVEELVETAKKFLEFQGYSVTESKSI